MLIGLLINVLEPATSTLGAKMNGFDLQSVPRWLKQMKLSEQYHCLFFLMAKGKVPNKIITAVFWPLYARSELLLLILLCCKESSINVIITQHCFKIV